MNSHKNFTITEAEHAQILEAGKPTPVMVIGGSLGSSPQEHVNTVWRQLATKYGVVWDTIRPYGSNPRDLIADKYIEPQKLGRAINIVLAPVGNTPSHTFIEIEYDDGRSLKLGTWQTHKSGDGLDVVRVTAEDFALALSNEVTE